MEVLKVSVLYDLLVFELQIEPSHLRGRMQNKASSICRRLYTLLRQTVGERERTSLAATRKGMSLLHGPLSKHKSHARFCMFPMFVNNTKPQMFESTQKASLILGKNITITARSLLHDLPVQVPINGPSVWLVHGYKADAEKVWMAKMEDSLQRICQQQGKEVVLVLVDWTKYSDLAFEEAAKSIPMVAKTVSGIMGKHVKVESAHMIGHSLGAHLCGVIGKELNGTVGHITGKHKCISLGKFATTTQFIIGLDPARPTTLRDTKVLPQAHFGDPAPCVTGNNGSCFELMDEAHRLSHHSAKFVDVYHTNAGYMGVTSRCGHVDIYFGACGTFQCECPSFHWLEPLDPIVNCKYLYNRLTE